MSEKVRFTTTKGLDMTATLNDSEGAAALVEHLPCEGLVQTLGAMVYFFVDFSVDEGEPTEEVEKGAVAYWPAGSALCIFHGGEPPSPVYVLGKVDGNPKEWRNVITGDAITVEKA